MTHDLGAVLDDMHAAILIADFGRLSQLVPDLETARQAAESAPHPAPHTVQQKAQRNAICLQAAMLGVKSAQRRIADVALAAKGLTTYDRGGIKATLSTIPPTSKRV